ncbi:hypothetical protein [Brevundimonas sp.]|uniref:hypothetical protein n=1 Tax=Brevundimonas sp. TaxID=1871086 RepID=UPI003BABDB10
MSRKSIGHHQSLSAIFAIPLILGVLALIGLVGALLQDGAWDLIGSALLAAAVGVVVWARIRARRR